MRILLAIPFFVYFFFGASLTINGQDKLQMQKAVDVFVNNPKLQGTQIGIAVVDVKSGELLASHHPDSRCSPASIQKIVTTAAAYELLGSDFRFETKLGYTGKIEGGVLNGDIIIQGGGDPSLGSNFQVGVLPMKDLMRKWKNEIQSAGIHSISGKVVVDGSFFSGTPAGSNWPYEDLGNYYGAGVWGFNIAENQFKVDFRLSKSQDRAPQLLGHHPSVPGLVLINELKTGPVNSGDQAYIYGGPYGFKRWVRGTLPAGERKFTIKGSLPDPAYFFASHFKAFLLSQGIDTGMPTTSLDFPIITKVTNLDVIDSPPLIELINSTHVKSVNIYAEALLRIIGKEKSQTGGLLAIEKWIASKGWNTQDFLLKDGSGLAPQNSVAAKGLVKMLSEMSKDAAYIQSLPKGGIEGTVKRLFHNMEAYDQIYLKSGGVTNVRSYAGYFPNDEEGIAFVLIVNNFAEGAYPVVLGLEKMMNEIYLAGK